MALDLFDLGMCKGQLYEVILTTWNEDGSRNAAPFGTIVKDENTIVNKIFEGSKTLENIKRDGEFVVNITDNPLYFAYSTIDNIGEESYCDGSLVLKSVDAYFSADTDEIKSMVKEDDIRRVKMCYIRSSVSGVVVNDVGVKPVNRGIHCVIEALVNYSRVDKVDDETREYYFTRFRENNRVVRKVGSKEDKLAMDFIIKNLEANGYLLY